MTAPAKPTNNAGKLCPYFTRLAFFILQLYTVSQILMLMVLVFFPD
ncbi:hypothetical protein BH18THE1_BH18THE1_01370 [soil metagenome]